MAFQPRVEVLMTSHDNRPFLEAQLASILAQDWGNFGLTVSDDGSSDGSWEVLKQLEADNQGRIKAVRGPTGFPINHLSLAVNADPGADYYAWSDGDDEWLPSHLSRAVAAMAPLGQDEPVLYGCREIIIDGSGRELGLTPPRDRLAPHFANALAQNILPGPTLVFNRPARELIALGLGPILPSSQDWWAYLMVSGAGGRVIWDQVPTVRYRLHGGNILGPNRGLWAKAARVRAVIERRFRRNLGQNLVALERNADRLTPESQIRLKAMARLHLGGDGPVGRLRLLEEAGAKHQSRGGDALFKAMAALGLL